MQFIQKHRFVIAALVVVILGAAILYVTITPGPIPDTTSFKARDFSFTYPRIYKAEEYATNVVSVGRANGDWLDPLVDVVKYKSDPDVATPGTFDAFMKRQAAALCGADGPTESITCTQIGVSAYTSPQGLIGQQLNLNLVRKNLKTATTSNTAYGPMYVFNTTASSTPDSPLRYSAVFVYPSLASFVNGSTSPELLQQIVDSLTFASSSRS